MILPNKFVTFDESVLSKFSVVLDAIDQDIEISHLYNKVENKFSDLDEFICALDILYALDVLDVDIRTRTVKYVG